MVRQGGNNGIWAIDFQMSQGLPNSGENILILTLLNLLERQWSDNMLVIVNRPL